MVKDPRLGAKDEVRVAVVPVKNPPMAVVKRAVTCLLTELGQLGYEAVEEGFPAKAPHAPHSNLPSSSSVSSSAASLSAGPGGRPGDEEAERRETSAAKRRRTAGTPQEGGEAGDLGGEGP